MRSNPENDAQGNEKVTIVGRIRGESDKAIWLKYDWEGRGRQVWIPKSISEVTSTGGPQGSVEVEIPRWFAEKNDLDRWVKEAG